MGLFRLFGCEALAAWLWLCCLLGATSPQCPLLSSFPPFALMSRERNGSFRAPLTSISVRLLRWVTSGFFVPGALQPWGGELLETGTFYVQTGWSRLALVAINPPEPTDPTRKDLNGNQVDIKVVLTGVRTPLMRFQASDEIKPKRMPIPEGEIFCGRRFSSLQQARLFLCVGRMVSPRERLWILCGGASIAGFGFDHSRSHLEFFSLNPSLWNRCSPTHYERPRWLLGATSNGWGRGC